MQLVREIFTTFSNFEHGIIPSMRFSNKINWVKKLNSLESRLWMLEHTSCSWRWIYINHTCFNKQKENVEHIHGYNDNKM